MAGLGTPLRSQPRNYPPPLSKRTASELEAASLQRFPHYNEASFFAFFDFFFFFFSRGACERAGESPGAGATAVCARGGLRRPARRETSFLGPFLELKDPSPPGLGGVSPPVPERFQPSPRRRRGGEQSANKPPSNPLSHPLSARTPPLLEAPPSPSPTPPPQPL